MEPIRTPWAAAEAHREAERFDAAMEQVARPDALVLVSPVVSDETMVATVAHGRVVLVAHAGQPVTTEALEALGITADQVHPLGQLQEANHQARRRSQPPQMPARRSGGGKSPSQLSGAQRPSGGACQTITVVDSGDGAGAPPVRRFRSRHNGSPGGRLQPGRTCVAGTSERAGWSTLPEAPAMATKGRPARSLRRAARQAQPGPGRTALRLR